MLGLRLFGIWLAITATSVQASEFAGAGETLQLLQKIQGAWQSGCYAVVRHGQTLYQRDLLKFSYTQMRRQATAFADSACRSELSKDVDRYNFTVGDVMVTGGGDRAFALNLTAQGPITLSPPLHAANLIHYHTPTGTLFLGQRTLHEPQQRLTELNRALVFRRR